MSHHQLHPQSNFRKRKWASLQHVEGQQPQKQIKSAVHTPVILSRVPNNRYDDLHYDRRQVGNLCIPYDPNQTVTLQTPVVTYSERSGIVSLTLEYHPISSTPLLELTTSIYDSRRPGSCMMPYSPTENNDVVFNHSTICSYTKII